MILVATYLFAAVVVGLYIAWFARRYKREQRNKAIEAEKSEQAFRTMMPPSPSVMTATAPAPPPPTSPTASPGPTASSDAPAARTVAAALSGISMPHDLVPLTTLPPRPGVVDQVAFGSKAPVSVVGPLFADELERLGYTVTPLDETSVAARRGNDNLIVYLHPEAPPPSPEGTVAVEVCIPF